MPKTRRDGYLDGQFLIAMPGMEDRRFQRSVVYLCAHSSDGAMGLIVNRAAPNITFPDLLAQLEIIDDPQAIRIPSPLRDMRVHRGGPVETGRGFVLHTADFYISDSTLPIDDAVSLTTTLEVLRAIAEGRGPENALLALGYAGWGPGQLEQEIQANGWLTADGDLTLLFDTDLDNKYDRALRRLGISPGMLSGSAGHA